MPKSSLSSYVFPRTVNTDTPKNTETTCLIDVGLNSWVNNRAK